MYKIIAIAGLIIRQFFLPNPFEPFGVWGSVYNLLASGAIGTLAYFTVGLFYEKKSLPFIGSLFYTITYIIYTLELQFVLKPYPNELLVILLFVIVIAGDIALVWLIRKTIK